MEREKATGRPSRSKFCYTSQQTDILEEHYQHSQYVSKETKQVLARLTHLPEDRIKVRGTKFRSAEQFPGRTVESGAAEMSHSRAALTLISTLVLQFSSTDSQVATRKEREVSFRKQWFYSCESKVLGSF